MPELAASVWVLIVAITLVAGFVKGSVGFAMPMIMISGLGSLLDPRVALAALILPTVLSNLFQALRGGLKSALHSANDHKRYILIVLVMIALSSQLVDRISTSTMYLLIGIPVVVFAFLQIIGVRFSIPPRRRMGAEFGIGGIAGFMGGVSGVWGPPTVLYLTALDVKKEEHLRCQGIIYGLASIALVAGHLKSGVLNASTAPLSAALVVPALAGIFLGFMLSDRFNQAIFRKATLAVLVIAGLNLVRRGLMT